ncbi:hypothetical protein D0Y50_15770 [Salinimonas sediminis]|uniref:Uncharacterized protein n=1 Tax=Salinimonas sediminis TaxID=2303538 RepID=A0A346NQ82_9ALTE|nr:hypothetical protein D0Y50_15770 [Salinimonas sediminis]
MYFLRSGFHLGRHLIPLNNKQTKGAIRPLMYCHKANRVQLKTVFNTHTGLL